MMLRSVLIAWGCFGVACAGQSGPSRAPSAEPASAVAEPGVAPRAEPASAVAEPGVAPKAEPVSAQAGPSMAPRAGAGVTGEVPSAEASSSSATLVVSVPESGQVMLGADPVSDDELGARLGELVAGDSTVEVLLDADQAVSYTRVVEVLDIIRAAGVTRVALAAR